MKVVARSRNSAIKAIDDYIAKTGLGTQWDKPQLLDIRPYKPPRTLDQNNKFHVMVRELAAFTGYSESEVKDYIKSEFGVHKVIAIDAPKDVPMSITEYSKEQLSELIERVYQIGAEIPGFSFGED